MRPFQNLPLLLWIDPSPFKHLYAALPESTPPSQNRYPLFGSYMRHSHNLPLPSRIYTPFLQLYVTLPKYILPSQNLPHPLRIYPLPLDMQPSHNLPIPPEYTPFWATICNANIIYPSLPEYTPPPFKHLYATLTESTLRPKILYQVGLPECTPSFQSTPLFYNFMRCSRNLSRPPRIYPALPEYTPSPLYMRPSRIYPFFTTTCDTPIIYPSLPKTSIWDTPEIHLGPKTYPHIYMRPSQKIYTPPII